jgi:hypothetical protein
VRIFLKQYLAICFNRKHLQQVLHLPNSCDVLAASLIEILILKIPAGEQDCQMAYFQTKNSNLGKFWRDFNGRCLYIFGYLVYYIFPFWYVVPRKIWQPCRRTFLAVPAYLCSLKIFPRK